MGAATTPAPAVDTAARPARPSLRSTRTISYRKNGDLITLELSNSKAAESLRELAKKNPATEQDKKFIADVEKAEAGGFVATVYDTLSFWVMEAMEIAMFGPYSEVQPA
jgi:hypothetical protein